MRRTFPENIVVWEPGDTILRAQEKNKWNYVELCGIMRNALIKKIGHERFLVTVGHRRLPMRALIGRGKKNKWV